MVDYFDARVLLVVETSVETVAEHKNVHPLTFEIIKVVQLEILPLQTVAVVMATINANMLVFIFLLTKLLSFKSNCKYSHYYFHHDDFLRKKTIKLCFPIFFHYLC